MHSYLVFAAEAGAFLKSLYCACTAAWSALFAPRGLLLLCMDIFTSLSFGSSPAKVTNQINLCLKLKSGRSRYNPVWINVVSMTIISGASTVNLLCPLCRLILTVPLSTQVYIS